MTVPHLPKAHVSSYINNPDSKKKVTVNAKTPVSTFVTCRMNWWIVNLNILGQSARFRIWSGTDSAWTWRNQFSFSLQPNKVDRLCFCRGREQSARFTDRYPSLLFTITLIRFSWLHYNIQCISSCCTLYVLTTSYIEAVGKITRSVP